MVTDRQSTVLRKVLVGFGDAEGPRLGPSHWKGRSCTPSVWLRALPGVLWDVVGRVMPREEQWYVTSELLHRVTSNQ